MDFAIKQEAQLLCSFVHSKPKGKGGGGQAVDLARAGRHVVVSTSTASGKSLCYLVPVLEALAADRSATALFMFPTKALAQVTPPPPPLAHMHA